jgi:hypothetical protein
MFLKPLNIGDNIIAQGFEGIIVMPDNYCR